LEEVIMLKRFHFIGLAAALFAAHLPGEAGAQTVGFATLPPGSILHAQASVIAKVVQDNSKLQVRVVGYGGDTGILEAVNSKKSDFWILDVGESADAFHGRGTWKGNAKKNLRTGITMYGFQMAFWVRKDSNINTIADLKGKRVPSEWVQQTGVIPHTTAVLAAGGVTYDQVVKVPEVNVVRAADDFKAGKLDVFFFAVGAPKVAEVAASVDGLRMLPYENTPEVLKRMQAVRPEYYLTELKPAPHIVGLDKPAYVHTFDFIIGVGAHVPDEAVYQFVKAVHGNKKDLAGGHPSFNRFDPANAAKPQPTLPHHPGAVKFFREAGIWRG
jgi:hypothetical protein